MLYQLLLYNNVNQLYVYMYPLLLNPPFHSPPKSHPSKSLQSTELSSLCYTAASHQLSISHTVIYICQYYSLNSPHPLLPSCIHKFVLYSFPVNRFLSTIFLDSIYIQITFLLNFLLSIQSLKEQKEKKLSTHFSVYQVSVRNR